MQKAAVALLFASVSAQSRPGTAGKNLNRFTDAIIAEEQPKFSLGPFSFGDDSVAKYTQDADHAPAISGELLPEATSQGTWTGATGHIASESRFRSGLAFARANAGEVSDGTKGTTFSAGDLLHVYNSPIDGSIGVVSNDGPQAHVGHDIRDTSANLGSNNVVGVGKSGLQVTGTEGAGFKDGKSWLLKSGGIKANTVTKDSVIKQTDVGSIDWTNGRGSLLKHDGILKFVNGAALGTATVGSVDARADKATLVHGGLTQQTVGGTDAADLTIGKVDARAGDSTIIGANAEDREGHESNFKLGTEDFRPVVEVPTEIATPDFSESAVATGNIARAMPMDGLNPVSYGAVLLTGRKP